MKSNVKSWILFLLSVFVLWQILAMTIHNPFIMPYPYEVILTMISFLTSLNFYKAIGISFLRIFISVCLSFLLAFVLSYASLRFNFIRSWTEKMMVIIRTVPNVVLIVLFLFWFSREVVTFLVSFLLLCPIIYESVFRGLLDIEREWKDVLMMFKQPFMTKFKYVHLPLLKTTVISSLVVACSMGFKVGIMAEILGQVPLGIGRQIQLAKLDVNLTVVLAWAIWIVLFVFILNALLKIVERRIS